MGVRYPNAEIASRILGENVTAWINQRRSDGATWRAIRDELDEQTGGIIDVVHETVRAWARIPHAGEAA